VTSRLALPNKRFEAGGARRLWSESLFSAPQLKRDSLDSAIELFKEAKWLRELAEICLSA